MNKNDIFNLLRQGKFKLAIAFDTNALFGDKRLKRLCTSINRSGNSTSPRLEHVIINRGPDKDDDVAEIADITDDILARECLLGELEKFYQKTFDVQNRAQAWG
jgi:hypothetical protein